MSNTTITLKITAPTSDLTGKAVANAVRRALSTHDVLPEVGEVKGVRFKLKQIKTAPRSVDSEIANIRRWAKANNVQVGDRGRIKAEVKAAYAIAQAK